MSIVQSVTIGDVLLPLGLLVAFVALGSMLRTKTLQIRRLQEELEKRRRTPKPQSLSSGDCYSAGRPEPQIREGRDCISLQRLA